MYKLITLSGGSDDLSIGFDRDRGRRQQELTNKNIRDNFISELCSKTSLVLENPKEKLITASVIY